MRCPGPACWLCAVLCTVSGTYAAIPYGGKTPGSVSKPPASARVHGRDATSITALSRNAAAKFKSAPTDSLFRRKKDRDVVLRKSMATQIKKSHAAAALRKTLKKSGLNQAAAMLRHTDSLKGEAKADRRAWTPVTDTMTSKFVALDTTARRAALGLPALGGTLQQQAKCKELGWALVSLYLDMNTGNEVTYNEGCSDLDLWISGIGFDLDADAGNDCQKMARNADQTINWDSSDAFFDAACWDSKGFSDYCSKASTDKCYYNGTQGWGTNGAGIATKYDDTPKWYNGSASTTGGPGFSKRAQDLLWDYQGKIHDSCQVVLFWDENEACPIDFGGQTGFFKKFAGDTMFSDAEQDALFPNLCSIATEKTSTQDGVSSNTLKKIESSYTRSKGSNIVPQDYVFMTYTESDSYENPWYFYPAPLPVYGTELLKGLAQSVGMACVNDGAATPDYCLPKFFNAIYGLFDAGGVFELLEADPFNDVQAKTVSAVLDTKICHDCNNKIFAYLYLMWADASEDDQYMALFAESLCSMAPNDDGIPQYCVPVLKIMEDDEEDDKAKAFADKLVLDPDSDGYNTPDNLKKVDAYWDAILEREANNWCDDLCVSISKMTDKKMMAIDLNSNKSYTCGAGQRPCTSAEKAEFTKMMENEEKTEAAYCAQVIRPVKNASDPNEVPDSDFCIVVSENSKYADLKDDLVQECLKFDPFDPAALASSIVPTSCPSDKCKAAVTKFLDPVDGWGCCAREMVETFNDDPDTQKLFNFIVATVDKCGLKAPDLCAAPDGSVISATFGIGNFDDVWYNSLNAGNKTALTMGVSADIANEVGVPKGAVTATATATAGTLTVTAKIEASSASQGVKITSVLNQFDTSRRAGAPSLAVNSLTANPDARQDPKLPVAGSTSGVGATFKTIDVATPFFVTITVTLPYAKTDFDSKKQDSYKVAVAAVAGTDPKNILLNITEARRRAGSVKVETKILAGSAARMAELKNTLGNDVKALQAKLDNQLLLQGLSKSSGVTAPTVSNPKAAAGAPKALSAGVMHAPSLMFGVMVPALVLRFSSL